VSAAAWFPEHGAFQRALAEAKARARRGAAICASLNAHKLTFLDAETRVWLAEVRR